MLHDLLRITRPFLGSNEKITTNQREGQKQIELLKNYATNENLWVNNPSKLGKPMQGGIESEVFHDAKNNKVYKLNNFIFVDEDYSQFFQRIIDHNRLFPSASYKFRGFAYNKENEFSAVLEQEFKAKKRDATKAEIWKYMNHRL